MVIELSCLYDYLSGIGKNKLIKIEIIDFSVANVVRRHWFVFNLNIRLVKCKKN